MMLNSGSVDANTWRETRVVQIVAMLETAGRDSTDDSEAINALRAVRNELRRLDLNMIDVIQLNPKKRTLQEQNRALQVALTAKEAEIAKLRSLLSANSLLSERPFYSWAEFMTAGIAKIGKTKGFQVAFLESNSDYGWGDLAKWRRLNQVPLDAMTSINTTEFKFEPLRGQDWTESEREDLRLILKKSPKIKMIDLAHQLSAKFGRTITEGAAKAAKKRI